MKLAQFVSNQPGISAATPAFQYNEGARECYANVGVDTDAAVETALNLPISVHCWQADDVAAWRCARVQ